MAFPQNSTPRLTSWLEGKKGARIISYVVIPILIIAALILPPISVPQRVLDLGTTGISDAGGTISDPDGTQVTFLPQTDNNSFRVKLNSIPRVTFLEGSAGKDLATAAKAIPANLNAKSPFYQLQVRGDASAPSTWTIPIPNDSEPYETLDAYTWDTASQSWQWLPRTIIREDDQLESRLNFVASSIMVVQTNPQPATVSADLALASALPAEGKGALAQVHPIGISLGDNGTLAGSIDASFDQLGDAYAVVPVVRNYDGPVVRTDLLNNMLADSAQREAHINAIVNMVVGNLYAGVDIDYHGVEAGETADFNTFVGSLAEQLHAQNKTLSVRVEPAAQVAEDRWDTGAYDWRSLGLLADTVKIPAPLDPRAYVPGGQVEALLNYAVGEVNRYKLEMVLSGQSVEQSGSYLILKKYADALQPLMGRVEADKTVVEPGKPINLALVSTRPNSGLVYDPNIGAYVYRYQDDQGNARTVWLENAASLSHKLQLLSKYSIKGFMVENLPADGLDADLWSIIRDYQQGDAKPIDSNLTVEWTLRGSDGELISQVRPVGDANLVVNAPAAPGALEINAALVDRGQVLVQQSASGVVVATYTPVATPTPVATATPAPTATPDVATLRSSSGSINMRSGPGTAYPKVADLAANASCQIIGKSEDGAWWQVDCSGKKGWVNGELTTASGPIANVAMVEVEPPPTAAPQPAAAPGAPAQPAGPAPRPSGGGSFAFGIQVDPYGGHYAQAKGLGFSWIKVQVPWKDFEGSKGNRHFPDDVVNNAAGNGLNVLASIVKAPNWARNPSFGFKAEGPPQNPQDYADFVGAFAGHFCGRGVGAIEVWNEENLWYEWGNEPLDAGRYMQLLAGAYRAIKGACPAMIVVSGAPTPTGAPAPLAIDDNVYLGQMYQAGLKNYADAIGAHPSGFANPPDVTFQDWQAGRYQSPSHANHPSFYFLNTLQSYRNIMVKYGDTNKRIWPTEFGWGSTGSPHAGYEYEARVSEQQQADWIVKAYSIMRNSGYVGAAFLWNLDYNATQGSTELAAFGILNRPAYGALAAMPK